MSAENGFVQLLAVFRRSSLQRILNLGKDEFAGFRCIHFDRNVHGIVRPSEERGCLMDRSLGMVVPGYDLAADHILRILRRRDDLQLGMLQKFGELRARLGRDYVDRGVGLKMCSLGRGLRCRDGLACGQKNQGKYGCNFHGNPPVG